MDLLENVVYLPNVPTHQGPLLVDVQPELQVIHL